MATGVNLERADVDIEAVPIQRFERLLNAEQYRQLVAAGAKARRLVGDRTIWNVNSTAKGGGVAEMLRSLIGYIRGAGLDVRWMVIAPASDEFFHVTKRLHNHLHGSAGDGGELDEPARRVYEEGLRPSAEALTQQVRSGDLVLLHDPQTAGLVDAMLAAGAHVIWRCHVGLDMPNDRARNAWRFLLPDVSRADACVFSRAQFAWEGLDRSKVWVIPPSIDAFSPKNFELEPHAIDTILSVAGVVAGKRAARAEYVRGDGTVGIVSRPAQMIEEAPASPAGKLVIQVSRWDRLKDPLGVILGFAHHVAPDVDADLIYAGPAVDAVSDDPEGLQVLQQAIQAWRSLPAGSRRRVHLATLPMVDLDENAVIVNALQRRADVVVQKSLAEGFGLTVAEAMWKGRPVVASRIGGIQDQIDHGRTGLLIDDPRDLSQYGSQVRELLADPARAAAIGAAARAKVCDYFLAPRHLIQYEELLCHLVGNSARRSTSA